MESQYWKYDKFYSAKLQIIKPKISIEINQLNDETEYLFCYSELLRIQKLYLNCVLVIETATAQVI